MPGEMIPIVLFICIVAIVKIVSDTHIKKQVLSSGTVDENAKEFLTNLAHDDPASLKWGMVLIAAGAVIMLAELLPVRISDQTLFGAILAAAGVAFMVHYFLASGKQKPASAN